MTGRKQNGFPIALVRVYLAIATKSSSSTAMTIRRGKRLPKFLGKLDLTPIILHERPNRGRTIIEKFEDYADVGFAAILLTPDDVGATAGSEHESRPRARQNVILELGFFLGRLGRDRVCVSL